MRSIGGAPSRVASDFAPFVTVPVVMSKPLSPRPYIAPTPLEIPNGAGTYAAHIAFALERTWNDGSESLYTP